MLVLCKQGIKSLIFLKFFMIWKNHFSFRFVEAVLRWCTNILKPIAWLQITSGATKKIWNITTHQHRFLKLICSKINFWLNSYKMRMTKKCDLNRGESGQYFKMHTLGRLLYEMNSNSRVWEFTVCWDQLL